MWSRLQPLSWKHRAWWKAWTLEPWDHDLSQVRWLMDWATQASLYIMYFWLNFIIYFLLLNIRFVSFYFSSPCVRLSCLFEIILASWGRPVLLHTSQLTLLLLHPKCFGLLCFHDFFHVLKKKFLFDFLVVHWLFSSMLFNLYIFVVFPEFFLWFTSSFISLWSVKMHGMTLIFLNQVW